MKKIFLLALALLLTAFGFCFHYLDGSHIGEKITAITSRNGCPLVFHSKPDFSLFPPRLSFAAISWNGQGCGSSIRFTASSGSVRPDLLSFLFGRGTLKEVILEKPDILIEPAARAKPGFARQAAMPAIDRLVLRDGLLRWRDLKLADLRMTAVGIDSRNATDAQCDFVLYAGDSQIGNVAIKSNLHYYAPNLTFRDGSAAFTAACRQLEPIQAQFSGSIALPQGADPFPGLNFNIAPGDVRYHGLTFEDVSFHLTGAAGACELEDFNCKLGGGNISAKGSLGLQSGAFSIAARGSQLELGKILAETGLRGFSGGGMDFQIHLESQGTAAGLLQSLSGDGKLSGQALRLDPLGEFALLLPLLGKAGKLVPSVIDSFEVGLNGEDGIFRIAPINVFGPDLGGDGQASLNAATRALSAQIRIRAGDLTVPLELGGTLDDLGWRIAPQAR